MNDPHTTSDDRWFDELAERVRRAEADELAAIERQLDAAPADHLSPEQIDHLAAAATTHARESTGTQPDGPARLAPGPATRDQPPEASPARPALLRLLPASRPARAALWFVSFSALLLAFTYMIWPGQNSTRTLSYELALQVLATDGPPAHKVSAMGRVTHLGGASIEALRRVLGPDRDPPPIEPLVEAVRAALDDIRAATEDGPIWVGPMPEEPPVMTVREAIEALDDVSGPPDWQVDAARVLKRYIPIGIYLTRSARGIDTETRVGSTQTILHLRDILGPK